MKTIAAGLLMLALSLPAAAQKPQNTAPRGAGQRLSGMDSNRDGMISRDEWKGEAARFDRLDSNHDGFLTRAELSERVREGRQRLQELDANQDAKISREEWRGGLEMFDRMDTNQDGYLTRDELLDRARQNRQRPGRGGSRLSQRNASRQVPELPPLNRQ